MFKKEGTGSYTTDAISETPFLLCHIYCSILLLNDATSPNEISRIETTKSKAYNKHKVHWASLGSFLYVSNNGTHFCDLNAA